MRHAVRGVPKWRRPPVSVLSLRGFQREIVETLQPQPLAIETQSESAVGFERVRVLLLHVDATNEDVDLRRKRDSTVGMDVDAIEIRHAER